MVDRRAEAGCRALADRVRFARLIAGMNQRQLASAIGMRPSQLRRLENGAASISAATLLRIAVAVDAPIGWLYGVDDSDHWPDTALATLLRDPRTPELVTAFARLGNDKARRLAIAMLRGLGDLDAQAPAAAGKARLRS
jgi:transcriptional regulator with XRE-family HTH domain